MKSKRALIYSILLLASLAATGAKDLGSRKLFDALTIAPDAWEADGVTVESTKTGLVLSLKGKSFGSAAPIQKSDYSESATIDLTIASIAGGTISAQIEWFDDDNAFIKATELLARDAKKKSVEAKKLSELLPAPDAKPKSFRIKFWLEGQGARATITKASAAAPRGWQDASTRSVHAYEPATAKLETDKGIRAEKQSDGLALSLDKGTKYSAVTFVERCDFSPDGVVMIDLPELKGGGVTLQALCWNQSGSFAKAVDVMKDVAEPGSHEIAFKVFADQFPSETKQVSFKLWLAGDDGAAARVQGIYYGIAGAAH